MVSPPDKVFVGNFEAGDIPMDQGDFAELDLFAVAEDGQTLLGDGTLLDTYTDLATEKTVITAAPHHSGDTITFQIVIKNTGAFTANNITVLEAPDPDMVYISDTCGFTSAGPNISALEFEIQSLGPGEVFVCEIDLVINGQVGQELINVAAVSAVNDYNSNNDSDSAFVTIE